MSYLVDLTELQLDVLQYFNGNGNVWRSANDLQRALVTRQRAPLVRTASLLVKNGLLERTTGTIGNALFRATTEGSELVDYLTATRWLSS
jgi:hypothetical protein